MGGMGSGGFREECVKCAPPFTDVTYGTCRGNKCQCNCTKHKFCYFLSPKDITRASASGVFAPRHSTGALPMDPTGDFRPSPPNIPYPLVNFLNPPLGVGKWVDGTWGGAVQHECIEWRKK